MDHAAGDPSGYDGDDGLQSHTVECPGEYPWQDPESELWLKDLDAMDRVTC